MFRFRTFDACAVAIASVLAASGLNAQPPNAQPPGEVRGPVRNIGHVVSESPRVMKFDAIPPDRVWKVVETAYKQAGVKPTSIEPSLYAMFYTVSPAGAKIGDTKIEDIFDCGGDKKSPLAATIPFSVNVKTVVQAVGEGSEVTTTVEATPVATEGGTAAPVCTSRGKLERKLEPQIRMAIGVGRVVRKDRDPR